MASITSTAAGKTSYSISTSAAASSAMAAVSAATATTGCPANSARSTASGDLLRAVGSTLASFRSPLLKTPRTPGTSDAALVSIRAMRAWAYGLRTRRTCTIPGRARSAA